MDSVGVVAMTQHYHKRLWMQDLPLKAFVALCLLLCAIEDAESEDQRGRSNFSSCLICSNSHDHYMVNCLHVHLRLLVVVVPICPVTP